MAEKKNDRYISKKKLKEILSNVGNIGYLIVFLLNLWLFSYMFSSFLNLFPYYETLLIRFIVLILIAGPLFYGLLRAYLPRYDDLEPYFISYLEDKDIEEGKKVERILNKVEKAKKYFEKYKICIITNKIIFAIIFGYYFFLLFYLISNPLDYLSFCLTFLIGLILSTYVLIWFGISSIHTVNVNTCKYLIINSFKSLLDDIDNKFEKFRKYRRIRNEILGDLLINLDVWFMIYRGLYFDNDESNDLMFEYRSSYFSADFKKYYYDVFLDLETILSDLEYKKEKDNSKDNQFNNNIAKLKKILKNYMKRLEFDIVEKKELKRRWREWLVILTTIIFIIISIFQLFFL